MGQNSSAKIINLPEPNSKPKGSVRLEFDNVGKVKNTIDNFLKVFEQDEYFKGLKFNLLTYSPEKDTSTGSVRWTDSDDASARHFIETAYDLHNVQKCDDAMRIIFSRRQYHPIKNLIESIEWDGEERLDSFLPIWTKCEDNAYTREVSRLIFAGGIHRLYEPGCKFDDMPVLIGTKQGEGKSTLVRWLALKDDYFSEVNEFEGQKGIESLEGAWICEVSELLAMTKTKEQEAVKSFLTRLNDRYRMPFDKRVTDHPRQCIFIGTTNKEQFLTDKTGNRRFYPVKVNQTGYELFKNEKAIKEYIWQCWAEAYHKLNTEELRPYANQLLINDIRANQSAAVEDDYRIGMIQDYLDNKSEVCIMELWAEALDMGHYAKPTKKDSNEISMIMQAMPDWEKQNTTKRFGQYGKHRWWKKIDSNLSVFPADYEDEPPF